MYGLDKIHKYWLFYGEYFPGVITQTAKPFSFYVDATDYDPERLLFNIDRNLLESTNIDGSKNTLSPESLLREPDKWLSRAISAIFQYNTSKNCKRNILISSSCTLMAIKKKYPSEKIAFSNCGINFIKIQKRSLKKLTDYPQAIDLQ